METEGDILIGNFLANRRVRIFAVGLIAVLIILLAAKIVGRSYTTVPTPIPSATAVEVAEATEVPPTQTPVYIIITATPGETEATAAPEATEAVTESAPAPSATANPDCPKQPTRLHNGDTAYVSNYDDAPLLVWEKLGDTNTANTKFRVVVKQPVKIISDPVCFGGRIWVKVQSGTQTGFSVEVRFNRSEDNTAYNLVPSGMPFPSGDIAGGAPKPDMTPTLVSTNVAVSDCNPEPRLKVGSKGRISPPRPTSLRVSPEQAIITRLPVGTIFDVLDGPVCGSLHNWWWLVKVGERTGYMPEGDPDRGDYWLEPFSQSQQ